MNGEAATALRVVPLDLAATESPRLRASRVEIGGRLCMRGRQLA